MVDCKNNRNCSVFPLFLQYDFFSTFYQKMRPISALPESRLALWFALTKKRGRGDSVMFWVKAWGMLHTAIHLSET